LESATRKSNRRLQKRGVLAGRRPFPFGKPRKSLQDQKGGGRRGGLGREERQGAARGVYRSPASNAISNGIPLMEEEGKKSLPHEDLIVRPGILKRGG